MHAGQHGFQVCGQEVGENGFEVCLECGRVRDRGGEVHHSAACKARKTGIKERVDSVFLYREIQSEATAGADMSKRNNRTNLSLFMV